MHLLFLKDWKQKAQTERSTRMWPQAVHSGRNRSRGGSLHGEQEGTGPTTPAREAMGSHPALVPSPGGTANSLLTRRIYPCGGAEQKGGRAGALAALWAVRERAEIPDPPPQRKHTLVIYGQPTFRAKEWQFPLIIAAFRGIQQGWEWSPKKRFTGFRSRI